DGGADLAEVRDALGDAGAFADLADGGDDDGGEDADDGDDGEELDQGEGARGGGAARGGRGGGHGTGGARGAGFSGLDDDGGFGDVEGVFAGGGPDGAGGVAIGDDEPELIGGEVEAALGRGLGKGPVEGEPLLVG